MLHSQSTNRLLKSAKLGPIAIPILENAARQAEEMGAPHVDLTLRYLLPGDEVSDTEYVGHITFSVRRGDALDQ